VPKELSWSQVQTFSAVLADRWADKAVDGVFGVPRGGLVPAALVAARLDVPLVAAPSAGTLVVDDIVDSGGTAARFSDHHFDALVRRSESPAAPDAAVFDEWVVFPWELAEGGQAGPTDAVVRILQHIGEDPTREGLLDTPKRVLKAFTEMTSGYQLNPADVLSTTFDVGPADELVVVRAIPFHSLCEHHLLGFTGTATVGYLPEGRVVGLSKLGRVVELYARRLQVQERMTTQIADAIVDHLDTDTAGVVVRARHSCMGCRGIQKSAEMVTSKLTGRLRSDPAMRAEFMALERGR